MRGVNTQFSANKALSTLATQLPNSATIVAETATVAENTIVASVDRA